MNILSKDLGYTTLIYLNRPERKNAYSLDMAKNLRRVLENATKRHDIIILTGKGGSFCSGGDIYEMHRAIEAGTIEKYFNELMDELDRIAEIMLLSPKIFISAVDGPAFGGGLSIVLASDIRIGTRRSRFGAAVVKIGLSPGFALSYLLPRIVGESLALDMLLTGRILDAEEALRSGLLNRIVENDDIIGECVKIASELSKMPRQALIYTKLLVRRSMKKSLTSQLRMERTFLERLVKTSEYREKVRRFVEKSK